MTATYSTVWRDYSGIRVREVIGPVGGLVECARWLGAQPYVSGPNGPMTDRILLRDGRRVSVWAELAAAGLTPLVRQHLSTEIFAGIEEVAS